MGVVRAQEQEAVPELGGGQRHARQPRQQRAALAGRRQDGRAHVGHRRQVLEAPDGEAVAGPHDDQHRRRRERRLREQRADARRRAAFPQPSPGRHPPAGEPRDGQHRAQQRRRQLAQRRERQRHADDGRAPQRRADGPAIERQQEAQHRRHRRDVRRRQAGVAQQRRVRRAERGRDERGAELRPAAREREREPEREQQPRQRPQARQQQRARAARLQQLGADVPRVGQGRRGAGQAHAGQVRAESGQHLRQGRVLGPPAVRPELPPIEPGGQVVRLVERHRQRGRRPDRPDDGGDHDRDRQRAENGGPELSHANISRSKSRARPVILRRPRRRYLPRFFSSAQPTIPNSIDKVATA